MSDTEVNYEGFAHPAADRIGLGAVGFENEALIDFRQLFNSLRKYLWTLLLLAFCAAIGGYAASFLIPNKYKAEALIILTAEEQGLSGLRSLAGQYGTLASLVGLDVGGANKSGAATVAILRSHKLVEKFISDHNLLPRLFPKRWDQSSGKWKTDGKDQPTLQKGADFFISKVLSVVEDRKTGLITVRIVWTDRQGIAGWVNSLVASANESARNTAILNASRSMDFLNKELSTAATIESRQSIYALLQSQMNKRMMANTRLDFAFTVVDPARTPEFTQRVSPSRIAFAVVGFLLALGVGCLVVLMRGSNVTTQPQ